MELQVDPGLLAGLYLGALCVLGLWGLHRLAFLWRFSRRGAARTPSPRSGGLPHVTVQLPVYNERTVVCALIRACGRLDWPRDRLEIQVLDDSTDETSALIDAEVAQLVAQGVSANVVRREGRSGFKAGALAEGLRRARGELLAVFDADFTPRPGFLREVVGAFEDGRVGMVQARWHHRNRRDTLLTRAQSVLLDGHFVIEHRVRHELGVFFNFNGTAGVWRREAIEQAGGWQHDTLTEDLDLSYRSQLAGWRFVYAPEVTCPAEVPPDVAAFKSQQRRWARGSVQVARKLLPRLVTGREPLRTRLEAVAHLTGNVGYPLVLLLALLLPVSSGWQTTVPLAAHLALFAACTLSVFWFYDTSQKALGRPLRQRALDVVAAVALGIGLSLSQTRAVIGGLRRETGTFERTAKRGDASPEQRYSTPLRGFPGGELALAAWMLVGMVNALRLELWGALPFLLLFFGGFAWVGGLSLRHWLVERSLQSGRLALAGGRALE